MVWTLGKWFLIHKFSFVQSLHARASSLFPTPIKLCVIWWWCASCAIFTLLLTHARVWFECAERSEPQSWWCGRVKLCTTKVFPAVVMICKVNCAKWKINSCRANSGNYNGEKHLKFNYTLWKIIAYETKTMNFRPSQALCQFCREQHIVCSFILRAIVQCCSCRWRIIFYKRKDFV